MQNLVNDDAVRAAVVQWKGIHVALAEAGMNSRRLQLHPGKAEHLGRAVNANGLARARSEQLDHASSARSDVDEASQRPLAEDAVDGELYFAFGHVQRADLVPDRSMTAEIASGGFGALPSDGFCASCIGCKKRASRGIRPVVDDDKQ